VTGSSGAGHTALGGSDRNAPLALPRRFPSRSS